MELPNLALIEEKAKNIFKTSFPNDYGDFEFSVHSQMFGSTTGLFSGIGGQMMTSYYITIAYNLDKNAVLVFQTNDYVGGFALNERNEKEFWGDVSKHNIKPLGTYVKR